MSLLQTGEMMERITDALSILTTNVKLYNSRGRTDVNAEAEDFYCGLLNIVLGKKLKNLNLLKMDFAAIDLADVEGKLCVQVTSTEEVSKITGTLEKFFGTKLDGRKLTECFDRLIVLMIGQKKAYRKELPKEDGFKFDPKEDIWDTAKLLREIERLDVQKQVEVDTYLQKHLDIPRRKKVPLDLPLRTSMDAGSFLGREAELAQIERRLAAERIVFLSGLGGMGKTELAIRYGQKYAESGRGTACFVHFRQDFFRTVVDEIAPVIPGLTEQGLDEKGKYQEAMKALDMLGREDILILDNADQANISALRRELNALPMQILVTTRMDVSRAISVGKLHREELYAMFRRHEVDIPQEDMDALITAVEGHTLTVDMMARTMRRGRRSATPEKLLEALNNHHLSGGFTKVSIDYAASPEQDRINEHLKAVFRVAELSEAAQVVLRCATLLPQNGIDDELFLVPFEDEDAVGDILDDLIEGGWLMTKEGRIAIHPVIRIVCIEVLQPTDENCAPFLRGIREQYDQTQYDAVKFRQMAELFTEAFAVLPNETGFWANEAGYLWLTLGEHQRALQCNLLTVEKDEKHQPGSKDLAASYNNVGSAYHAQGDYEQAVEYLLKALAIQEKTLPAEHPDLATSYNNVGLAYGAMGDHKKALEYQLKALAIREKIHPAEHPDLATSYNNVGSTYGYMGDHKKALEYQMKDLVISEKVLPAGHPDLATSYNNVGGTYGNLGDHEKALEYQLKALVIREKVLPSEHPDLAQSYDNVGITYYAHGDYERALEYQLKALAIREKVLPSEHPDLAISYNNAGGTYGSMGDHEKEVEYQLKALVIQERSLPAAHPYNVMCCSNISQTYAQLEDFARAAEYAHRARTLAEQSMAGHPMFAQFRQLDEMMAYFARLQKRGIPFDNPFKE